jgi:hypothetical protein
VTTRFIGHVLVGAHGSRPAASAVPEGALYSCTTHGLVYQSDTATWTTWLTAGGLADTGTFTYLDAAEAAAPSTPTAGTVRIYAKSDGRIYSKDDGGTEYGPFDAAGGAGGFDVNPAIVQQKLAGNAVSSITMDSAPGNGNTLILFANGANTGDPTAISSTNTTWTKVANAASAGAKYSLWVGVVSGGAGGTSITITHANAFLTVRCLEVDMALVASALNTASHATSASLTATAGNIVIAAAGNDNTTIQVTLVTNDATGFALHASAAGTFSGTVASLVIGYAGGTTVPGLGTSTSMVLMAELAAP